MQEPTEHQRYVLRLIRDFQWKRLRSPSNREIAHHLGGRSTFAVQKTLAYMTNKGMIQRDKQGRILFPREALNEEFFRKAE